MKFVEFFGMPGSGKTYLTAKLKKKKNYFSNEILIIYFKSKSIYSILNKISSILIALPFILKSRSLQKLIYFFRFFYKPINSKYYSIRTLSIFFNTLYLISIIKLSNFAKKKIILVDQGFYQIFSSIIYEMNILKYDEYNDLIKKWILILSNLKVEHRIIGLNSQKQSVLNRIINRKGDSIMDNRNNHKYFYYYSEIFKFIISILKKEIYLNYAAEIFTFDSKNLNLINLINSIDQ